MAETRRWLRLTVARENTRDPFLRAALDEDVLGVYVDDKVSRFKAYAEAFERDARGREHTRQVTRTFPIRSPELAQDALDEARSWKSQTETAAALRRERPKVPTLDDVFAQYMGAKTRRPSSERLYRGTYANHIAPHLGSWEVARITHEVAENWWRKLDASPGIRVKAGQLMRQLLRFAHDRGIVPANAGTAIHIEQQRAQAVLPADIPSPADVERLADEIGPRFRALIFLLAYGGLRVAEAVGLRVARVDFERGRVTIDQQATEVGGRLEFGPPKTARSGRTIALPRRVVDELARHVREYPTPTGLVFSTTTGGPLRVANFRERHFHPAARRAGVRVGIHDLRHVCASTLASSGASLEAISARLGHSSVAITQQVYVHLLLDHDERLARLQDDILDGVDGRADTLDAGQVDGGR